MKKIITIVISVLFFTTILSGCSSANNKTGTSEEITEATTTTSETTTEETTTETTITYETYNLMNIQFDVPDTWYYEKDGDTLYFYPDENNLTVHLEVSYVANNKTAAYSFDTVFDSMVDSLPELEGASVNVNKKVTMIEGDFYIGKVDYTATTYKATTQNYLVILSDINTGDIYGFGFCSPKSIREEHTQIINEIINSVRSDYDF